MLLLASTLSDNSTIRQIVASAFDNSSDEEYHSPKLFEKSETTNYEICAKCEGACCKKCGCHFSPDDFDEISFDRLKAEIEKGYISIDYVDGEMIYKPLGIYILRVRNIDSPIIDIGYRTLKPCVLLTEQGCKLDYEHRPTGGKLLIPSPETNYSFSSLKRQCKTKYSINMCCREWMPYQKIIYQLIEYFRKKDFPCSI